MKIAEDVTFGGGGGGVGGAFDRAAECRGDAAAMSALAADAAAATIVLWRGKPLVAGMARDALARVALDHPALAGAPMPPVFLGRDGPAPVFATDLSGWEPEDLDFSTLGAFLDPSEQHHPQLGPDRVFAELRSVMIRLTPRDAELAATAKAILGWHQTHRFCARCGHESAMAKSGWQRDCAACGAHHFPRTDPVVIMLIQNGNDVLLGRSPGWPDGMYSLLAGFVEPGETMEAAVRREVFEEAGIRVGRVGYLASQPWAFPSSLMLGCRGEALDREITLDRLELEDALWIGRERLMEVFARRDETIRPAREGAIAHFLLQNWLAGRLD